jgi:catechol-2,3-dioxygenase
VKEIAMLRAERLGYLLLNVEDLERSVEFWTRAVNLEVSEERNGRVYLRGGLQHHWIVLQEAPERGLARVGIEVAQRADLDAMEQNLRDAGIAVESGDGLESDRVLRYVRFNDPSGNPLELYCDMITMPTPPNPRYTELLDIQHIVLLTRNPVEAAEFYNKFIGLRVSDWIEQNTAFMNFRNGWHHGIGVGGGRGNVGRHVSELSGLSHVCFQPPDLDSVMKLRAVVHKLDLPVTRDLIRHGPSGSVGFYFGGEDTVVEFSYGARNYPPDLEYKPRILPVSRETGDVWQAPLAALDRVDEQELQLVEAIKEQARLALPSGR